VSAPDSDALDRLVRREATGEPRKEHLLDTADDERILTFGDEDLGTAGSVADCATLCVMAGEARDGGGRVGVRELRQNLSVYLDRVKAGERLEVTEHGQPVALLVPLPPGGDPLARWVAEGRATAPRRDLADVLRRHPARPARPGERALASILEEMRAEEGS